MQSYKSAARPIRARLLIATAVAAVSASPALAQSAPDIPPISVPLNDVDCDWNNATSFPGTVPPCATDGTRTAVYNGRTRTYRSPTTDTLTDTYSVSFSGNLAVDGAPAAIAQPFTFPYSNPGEGPMYGDVSNFIDPSGQVVNVDASYTGELRQTVATGGSGVAALNDPAYWTRVSNLAVSVNSIDINSEGEFGTADGEYYEYKLKSDNPNNVVNQSTSVSGSFRNDGDDATSIQFGKLTGTATVVSGPNGLYTPYPEETGAQNTGVTSLFALDYDVQANVTTQLDENGLFTPKIAVTDGIAMGGSRITGLAAGVNGTDAVNKAQLDAAIAGAGGGNSYLRVNSTAGTPQVSGNGAIGLGGNASATGANALAIGGQSKVTAEAGVAIGGDSGADPDTQGARAELYATAIGTDANAAGTAAGAIGAFARATNNYATAIGFNSSANGTNATAIGAVAFAAKDNSTAIGANASATHAGSTAVGAGAQTTAENQLVLGNKSTAVVVAGIDASTAAQQGPVDVVTVDANGTLGRQKVATAQSVQDVRASLSYIAAVTDTQFADLSGRVGVIETRLNNFDIRMEGVEGGVAAAMAMGQAKLVPDANVSMTVAAATYGGQQGYAGSISGRVTDKVYISGSVSGNTGDKRVGGAVSATFGF